LANRRPEGKAGSRRRQQGRARPAPGGLRRGPV